MSRIATFMAACIGSGLLVVILAIFANRTAASIAFLVLVPSCAFILLRLNRAGVVESHENGSKQFWYRAAGFAMIAGAVVQLLVQRARASNSGTSLGVGSLAQFALEMGIAIYLLMPIQKAR